MTDIENKEVKLQVEPTEPTIDAQVSEEERMRKLIGDICPPIYIPDEKDIRTTGAPIKAELMKEYFLNKKICYNIVAAESRLKGITLLTYASNLSINSDIVVDLNDYEEYSTTLLAYISQRAVLNAPSLAYLTANALFHFIGTPYKENPFQLPVSEEFVTKFCFDNAEVLANWCIFLGSMNYFIALKTTAQIFDLPPEDKVTVIEDSDFIGHNVVNMFRLPTFMINFVPRVTVKEPINFVKQFNEYMFGNQNLVYYFQCPNNDYNHILSQINLLTNADFDEVAAIIEKAPIEELKKQEQ